MFNGIFLNDRISFFLLYTSIVTGLFLSVKLYLYSKLNEDVDHPLMPSIDLEGEPGSILRVIFLIILVLFGFALPFLVLAFVDPITWFALLTGFIAGINLPELILYTYSFFEKRK
jgi:hypothetical protein